MLLISTLMISVRPDNRVFHVFRKKKQTILQQENTRVDVITVS